MAEVNLEELKIARRAALAVTMAARARRGREGDFLNTDAQVAEEYLTGKWDSEGCVQSALTALVLTEHKAMREENERLRAFVKSVTSGEAFREMRFAEDNDADYFLRAQRNVIAAARTALRATQSPTSKRPYPGNRTRAEWEIIAADSYARAADLPED